MGLTNFGMGPGNFLTTGGLGQRVQQTAHPPWFNTPVVNPDNWVRRRSGTDGDTEYAVWTPDPDCVYNARAAEVFLPEAFQMPPGSEDRLRTMLGVTRPKTCTIRVSETRGPERVLLPATGV